ncbi:C45 family autoproteolytic acyltransferase/hydolase [Halostagnicola kamekurae]|uniref:Predicted choloylglycine hydrolase n=1 Tax=Halostagnicola kamekurae TaxID=619731 RepID=A0A1I6TJB5_9EURY|nr:C45 family peptidase [Halostagnicola kamekurae]SFS89260.1 Predicted choloylglycine hydrolase [Halostagnicola kamekurae]
MDEYEIDGSHYEMGQQFGTQLEQEGLSLDAISVESVDRSEEMIQFASECEPLIEKHYPKLLHELQGIADRTGVDTQAVKSIPLALNADPGCSLIAISDNHTAGDVPLFGRNHDFYPSLREYSKLFHTTPEDGLASVGCAHNFVGRLDGVNEAGLAIGFSGVPTDEYAPGFMWPLAVRTVLDTCHTVSEAVSCLEDIPHSQNVNFLVADKTGSIALIEASPKAVNTIRPDDGFARATNQFTSESMQEYQSSNRVPTDCSRFQRLGDWFCNHSASIELDDLQTVMSNPETGVCWRIDEHEGDDPRATIWSWTMEVGEGISYLARGSPAETAYEPIFVPESTQ